MNNTLIELNIANTKLKDCTTKLDSAIIERDLYAANSKEWEEVNSKVAILKYEQKQLQKEFDELEIKYFEEINAKRIKRSKIIFLELLI